MGEVKGMFIRQTFFKSFSKSLYLLAFKIILFTKRNKTLFLLPFFRMGREILSNEF